MTRKLVQLLGIGEQLLREKLEEEFRGFAKVHIKLNVESNAIYSWIEFSKKNYWGAVITIDKDCTPDILNALIEETINAYKDVIYKKLTGKESSDKNE